MTNAAAGNKTIKIYLGTTTITIRAAANDNTDWFFKGIIAESGTDTQYISYTTSDLDGDWEYVSMSEVLSESIKTLHLTGECANGGDSITQTILIVERLQ